MHFGNCDDARVGSLKLLIVLLLLSVISFAQDLTIAAAADLQFAMRDVVSRFEQQTGKTVNVIYGSSGNFTQQIQNGAPFDLFFSADVNYPTQLQSAGLTDPASFYEYANGKIVLWVPKQSAIDLNAGLKSLLAPSVGKIAIANPQHAPYGRAAVAALQSEGVYVGVKHKLVLGESVSQAASFAASGAADAGIIALSLAIAPTMKDKGRFVEVPASHYQPIRQAAVILRSSKHTELSRQFLAFFKTPAITELLGTYGFDVPHGR